MRLVRIMLVLLTVPVFALLPQSAADSAAIRVMSPSERIEGAPGDSSGQREAALVGPGLISLPDRSHRRGSADLYRIPLASVPALASLSIAPYQEAAEQEEQARDFLERLRVATGTPAVSGAVALNGTVVFAAGTGFIDLANLVPATGASVYNIGSISKVITGIAVMQLVEQGRVDLDDDIRRFVPEFPEKSAPITLRHLLTHTSGIRHYRDNDFPGTPDGENMLPVHSFRDALNVFADDALLFTPGAYYFYTSYGVNLLEGVVESASGMPFEQYLRERVWGPAGLASTAFDVPTRVVPHRARSYRRLNGELVNEFYGDLRYKFASGGMISSVEDLVRLGSALNRGLLVADSTRRIMFTDLIPDVRVFQEGAAPIARRYGQGVLWRLRQDAAGRRVAFHCGSVTGFNACLVNFYDEDLVAAIATNSWECCGWSKADSLAGFFRANMDLGRER